jgi:peroxiredoxin
VEPPKILLSMPPEEPDNTTPLNTEDALARAITTAGPSVLDLSRQRPLLVVFLRHSGCPFCIETLRDLSKQRQAIEGAGVGIVLFHMGPEPASALLFDANGVGDLPRVSDPERALYRALGLRRGGLWALAAPSVWWRLMRAAFVGKRLGKAVGDPWQMPGAFVVHKGRVIRAFRHRTQGDRPAYTAMACSLPSEDA